MFANKGLKTLDMSNNDFGVNGLRMLVEVPAPTTMVVLHLELCVCLQAIASHPKLDAFDVRWVHLWLNASSYMLLMHALSC